MNCACLILAAGKGTRMKSDLAKVLHPLSNRPLVDWVMDASRKAGLSPLIMVLGHQAESVREAIGEGDDLRFAIQEPQLGTGHAVMMAEEELCALSGDVLVLAGDVPLIRADTLTGLLELHRSRQAAATVLTAILDDPTGYGRIIRNEDGDVEAIREHRDASGAEKSVREINTGIYCFRIPDLLAALAHLSTDNDQGEYYLTDTLQILRGSGERIAASICPDPDEIGGINTLDQLLAAEATMQGREG